MGDKRGHVCENENLAVEFSRHHSHSPSCFPEFAKSPAGAKVSQRSLPHLISCRWRSVSSVLSSATQQCLHPSQQIGFSLCSSVGVYYLRQITISPSSSISSPPPHVKSPALCARDPPESTGWRNLDCPRIISERPLWCFSVCPQALLGLVWCSFV